MSQNMKSTSLRCYRVFISKKKNVNVVRFPDNRICLFCKGADNVILEKLKNSKLAQAKARDFIQSAERKTQEADVILQSRLSPRG